MPRLDVVRDPPPADPEELASYLQEQEDRYGSVRLRGTLLHPSIVDLPSDDEVLQKATWVPGTLTAILEPREETPEGLEEEITREEFVAFDGTLPLGDFLRGLETLGASGVAEFGEYSIGIRDSEYLANTARPIEFHTSEYQHGPTIRRPWPTHVFEYQGHDGELVYEGDRIQRQTVPGPLELHTEDPPYTNIHDAIREFAGLGTQLRRRGSFFLFKPSYTYRILETSWRPELGELQLTIDAYDDTINEESGLRVSVVKGNNRDPTERVRETRRPESHTVTFQLEALPKRTHLLLHHEEFGLVDARTLQPGRETAEYSEVIRDQEHERPYVAGAVARMALLRFLQECCQEQAVEYSSDDRVKTLAHILHERGHMTGLEVSQIQNWYDVLSKAAHLQTEEVREDEIRRTIDSVMEYIGARADESGGGWGFQ